MGIRPAQHFLLLHTLPEPLLRHLINMFLSRVFHGSCSKHRIVFLVPAANSEPGSTINLPALSPALGTQTCLLIYFIHGWEEWKLLWWSIDGRGSALVDEAPHRLHITTLSCVYTTIHWNAASRTFYLWYHPCYGSYEDRTNLIFGGGG